MLSLYDKNFKLPELLPKFNKLFIEKMQCPLALLPPSADEQEAVNITISSCVCVIQIKFDLFVSICHLDTCSREG